MTTHSRALAFGSLVAILAGCAAADPSDRDQNKESVTSTHQALGNGNANGAVAAPWYPQGPYGTQIGSVVDNLAFDGKRDANGDGVIGSADPVVPITLSDYARHGQTKTRVLVLSACAVWCGPCNQEQKPLIDMYNAYAQSAPGQVKLVSAMLEDINFRAPVPATLDRWSNRYHVPYDMILDPDLRLLQYATQQAFPTHLVIRTKGMTLAAVIEGSYLDQLHAAIDAVLAEPPGDSD
jgi:hypothetical protein